jgi:hypothetical protein
MQNEFNQLPRWFYYIARTGNHPSALIEDRGEEENVKQGVGKKSRSIRFCMAVFVPGPESHSLQHHV